MCIQNVISRSDESDTRFSIPTSPVCTAEMKDKDCEDVDLLSLSCKLAHQFSVDAISRCLGLQESQVQDALKRTTEQHQDHNIVHLLLIKWQEVNGDRATLGALIEQSLSNPKLQISSEIADVIKDELKNIPPRK